MSARIKNSLLLAFSLTLAAGCDVQTEESPFVNDRGADHDKDKDGPTGCTYTIGYYKNHNKYGEGNQYDPWPLDEDYEACGDTWLNWLWTPTEGEHKHALAKQFIGAYLNVANGAEVDEEVQNALWGAQILLDCNPIAPEDLEYAMELNEILDAFNNGEKSAPSCDSLEEEEEE